jgi:uncharacterized membrane protein
MFVLSIKQGLHIVVGIYKGAPIYGLMFGTLLAIFIALFAYKIICIAERKEKQETEADRQYQKQIEVDREKFLQRIAISKELARKEVLKASPWYVGINDDLKNS